MGSSRKIRPRKPRPGRNEQGQFVAGNVAALVHGCRSDRVASAQLPEQVDVRAVLRETEAAIVADLGGPENLSTVKASLVRRYLAIATTAEWLESNLIENGFLTGKGKSRAALTAYLGVVDRLVRLANVLGIERKAKPALDLASYLARVTQGYTPSKPASGPQEPADSGEGPECGVGPERPVLGDVAFDLPGSGMEPTASAGEGDR